jgi:hypothetical protein
MDVPRVASISATSNEPLAGMLRWTVATATALIAILGLVLVARRLGGYFQQPLNGPLLFGTGLVLAATATMFRVVWRPASPDNVAASERLMLVVPRVAVLIYASLLALPNFTAWTCAFWIVILGEEIGWTLLRFPYRARSWQAGRRLLHFIRRNNVKRTAQEEPYPSSSTLERDCDLPVDTELETASANIFQQITRAREDDGSEVLFGLLRGQFAAGERSQNLHVGFCPPLERVPSLTWEQVEGPRATIRAAQVESFGARLDLRLDCVYAEATSVLIEFYVHAAAQSA